MATVIIAQLADYIQRRHARVQAGGEAVRGLVAEAEARWRCCACARSSAGGPVPEEGYTGGGSGRERARREAGVGGRRWRAAARAQRRLPGLALPGHRRSEGASVLSLPRHSPGWAALPKRAAGAGARVRRPTQVSAPRAAALRGPRLELPGIRLPAPEGAVGLIGRL